MWQQTMIVVWPVLLLAAGLLCYYGIRRDRKPWPFFAFVAALALVYWGGAFLLDFARWWSGFPLQIEAMGVEVWPALGFVAWRHRGWLERAGRFHGR